MSKLTESDYWELGMSKTDLRERAILQAIVGQTVNQVLREFRQPDGSVQMPSHLHIHVNWASGGGATVNVDTKP